MQARAAEAERGRIATAPCVQIEAAAIGISADTHARRAQQHREIRGRDAEAVALEELPLAVGRVEHNAVEADAEGETHALITHREAESHRREHARKSIGIGKGREQKSEEEYRAEPNVCENGPVRADEFADEFENLGRRHAPFASAIQVISTS